MNIKLVTGVVRRACTVPQTVSIGRYCRNHRYEDILAQRLEHEFMGLSVKGSNPLCVSKPTCREHEELIILLIRTLNIRLSDWYKNRMANKINPINHVLDVTNFFCYEAYHAG